MLQNRLLFFLRPLLTHSGHATLPPPNGDRLNRIRLRCCEQKIPAKKSFLGDGGGTSMGKKHIYLGGGLKHFLFTPLPGEMIQFD